MHSANTATYSATTSLSPKAERTEPTGRSFLSYRRSRHAEAALLIAAQQEHGIPTWQDVRNLDCVPAEDEIRRVLADPTTASAVMLITPEVEESKIIRNVEIPKIIQRAEAQDGFFVVPVAAGGLSYEDAAQITSNHLSAQNLSDWNLVKVPNISLMTTHVIQVIRRILTHRIQSIHCDLPEGAPLRMGMFVRRAPAFEIGNALTLDWSSRFLGKEASAEDWNNVLIPALSRVVDTITRHASARRIEAFGFPTLPAAVALGASCLSTSGIQLAWQQFRPGHPDQLWSIEAQSEESGFCHRIFSKDVSARDVALLLSVSDDVEPLFASCQQTFGPFRAMAHVMRSGNYPHQIHTAGQAMHVALVVQDALRTLRREYGNVGTVHLFLACPAGLAVLVGQLLNTFGSVQTYEHVARDGSGAYEPAVLLRPSNIQAL